MENIFDYESPLDEVMVLLEKRLEELKTVVSDSREDIIKEYMDGGKE